MAVVLVVEDDADTCESLARLLQREHHVAVCAANGREAMVALVDQRPQLVLLDLKLPEMDGIAFLNVLRSYLRWTHLPVIVITGMDDPDIDEQSLQLGVKRIFHKTKLDLRDLAAAISEVAPPN